MPKMEYHRIIILRLQVRTSIISLKFKAPRNAGSHGRGFFVWKSSWYVVSENKQCLITNFVPLLLDDGRTMCLLAR